MPFKTKLLAVRCAATLCLFTAACAPSRNGSAPSPRAPSGGDASTSVYRVDYVVSAKDASAPAATSSAYTMVLEERRGGEVMVGSNVPLSATSPARTDVGLKIHGQFTRTDGDAVLVETRVEMTFKEDGGGGFRKLGATTEAFVPAGQPTLVASLDDPASLRRYQLTVTATRVR